jgi:hypothetical protein
MQSLIAASSKIWQTGQVAKVFPILMCCVLAGAGFAFWKLRTTPFPTNFDLTFSATGLVEKVDYKKETCVVKVAVYDWINLSQGFELSEIPGRSDRYYLHGQGEACQALTVAMASTEQHIGFQAGRSGKSWYFVASPTSAVACGGMKVDWKPDPES